MPSVTAGSLSWTQYRRDTPTAGRDPSRRGRPRDQQDIASSAWHTTQNYWTGSGYGKDWRSQTRPGHRWFPKVPATHGTQNPAPASPAPPPPVTVVETSAIIIDDKDETVLEAANKMNDAMMRELASSADIAEKELARAEEGLKAALEQLSACEAVSDVSQAQSPEGPGDNADESDDETDRLVALRNVRRHQDEVVHRSIAADPKVQGL